MVKRRVRKGLVHFTKLDSGERHTHTHTEAKTRVLDLCPAGGCKNIRERPGIHETFQSIPS